MDVKARELDELLRGKNSCLRKFRALSRDFAGRATQGDLTGLTEFESRRESILKAIALFDRKIDFVVPEIRETEKTSELVLRVEASLSEKEGLVKDILEADLAIISRIETEKNRILKDLTANRKGAETLSKFKSTWIAESGEELDQKL